VSLSVIFPSQNEEAPRVPPAEMAEAPQEVSLTDSPRLSLWSFVEADLSHTRARVQKRLNTRNIQYGERFLARTRGRPVGG